jgi:glycosyltransferase involved in cell wall biosynthesis
VRIAVTYGPMCLQRSPDETWADPRTGSEIGWRRIVEELRELGHDVVTWACPNGGAEVAISINEPDSLRNWKDYPFRVCCFWLNDFKFCQPGYDEHVDLYLSPSVAHRQKAIHDWGAPSPQRWLVNPLGCDLADYSGQPPKVRGRCVYASSPDRGLHRLLESWPSIKRACPWATLRIFYELDKWFRGFDETPHYPPIEKNRARALYVEEALRRLSGPEWGIEVIGSIDRKRLARELSEAEVYAYPCETVSWSEGFSCATLEACAAEACPIITNCDALGDVYRAIQPVPLEKWTDKVIACLNDSDAREAINRQARKLAEELTWANHAKRLEQAILQRL